MEQLTIPLLGFPLRFQEDIKIPRSHGTINYTVIRALGFPIVFQEDIKITITIIIIILILLLLLIIIIIIVVIIVILASPDARCESGQTSGSSRNLSKIEL